MQLRSRSPSPCGPARSRSPLGQVPSRSPFRKRRFLKHNNRSEHDSSVHYKNAFKALTEPDSQVEPVGHAVVQLHAVESLWHTDQHQPSHIFIDILATGADPVTLKPWTFEYRNKYGVKISRSRVNVYDPTYKKANFTCVMKIPMIGPIMHQELKFAVVRGEGKSPCIHRGKVLGSGSVSLQPLLLDGETHVISIPLTHITHVTDSHAATGTADHQNGSPMAFCYKGDSSCPGKVFKVCEAGLIKATISLDVNEKLDRQSYFRNPEKNVSVEPHFTASRLYHALVVCDKDFVEPVLDILYKIMSLLSWESFWYSATWLYFVTLCILYYEWAPVMVHIYLIYLIASYPFWYMGYGAKMTARAWFGFSTAEYRIDDLHFVKDEEYVVVTRFPSRLVGLKDNKNHHIRHGKYPAIAAIHHTVGQTDEAHKDNIESLALGDLLVSVNGVGVAYECAKDVEKFLFQLERRNNLDSPKQSTELLFRRPHGKYKHVHSMVSSLCVKFGALARMVYREMSSVRRALLSVPPKFDEFGERVDCGIHEKDQLISDYVELSNTHLPTIWDHILTALVGASKHSPDEIYETDPKTGRVSLQVDGAGVDLHWVDPDPNNPTSLSLSLQHAQNNLERMARVGNSVQNIVRWNNFRESRFILLCIIGSCVVHILIPNRYIYMVVLFAIYFARTRLIAVPWYYLQLMSVILIDRRAKHAQRPNTKLNNRVNYIRIFEYQKLVEGSWVPTGCSPDEPPPWLNPRYPRICQNPEGVHLNEKRFKWVGDERGQWHVVKMVNGELLVGDSKTQPGNHMMPRKRRQTHVSLKTNVVDFVIDDANDKFFQYGESWTQFDVDGVPANRFERTIRSRVRRRCWQRAFELVDSSSVAAISRTEID